MTKITILGSTRFFPYDILASPYPLSGTYLTRKHDDEAYQESCKIFYPAIEKSDEVWVYMPDGKIGEHTQRDLQEAIRQGKKIFKIVPMDNEKLTEIGRVIE